MATLETPDFIHIVSQRLQLRPAQVRAAVSLLQEGNTIPFIARYRKEVTGELDEHQLRAVSAAYEAEQTLHARKCDVLRLLEEQGVFADPAKAEPLTAAIAAAKSTAEVDDIYRPYRPKRKTRASVARAQGLAPLAAWLAGPGRRLDMVTVRAQAARFVRPDGAATADDALQGACDILAEEVADDPATRGHVRSVTERRGVLCSRAVDPAAETVYAPYYDYREPVAKVPPHRVLAVNRGEREGVLKVSVEAPVQEIFDWLYRRHGIHLRPDGTTDAGGGMGAPIRPGADGPRPAAEIGLHRLRDALDDAYKRLIAPAVEREVRNLLTERAEAQAIRVFAENLRALLLQPPLRGKVVLGVDPAYRTGCKLAVVDATGKLLDVAVIYPTPPHNRAREAAETVQSWICRYRIEVIAIGNGTASRETEAFIADCLRSYNASGERVVSYTLVSEAGASVYSASELAGEEFPDLDVAERSAVSIARRLQDPLAELVKIDPASIGVGQYQHDVSQKQLGAQLRAVVESAVNQVGVNVNTASERLLAHVAGLNRSAAHNIVAFRNANGRFRSRRDLAKVPRLGPKTLEQCVGFLRVLDGDEVLDATPIHPESYPAVHRLLALTGRHHSVLADATLREAWLTDLRARPLEDLCRAAAVGIPTLRDILEALERPGRDPRDDVPGPVLRTDVLTLEDLSPGMELTGTVRNVVDFGAFVDVGLKTDGLVHVSQLAERYVKHPLDVVAVGDIVRVRVLQVDAARQRLGLTMRGVVQESKEG
ncbi:MAG: RNA-binding transcriptional accessory protein [Alicyclobacillus sp.]|nr:RNA-binding transcriptional accessory protein [Alicyclobacillus sp.]